MITAYQTSISLSSHALLQHEPLRIILQILYETANAQSSAGDADGVNYNHLQQFWEEWPCCSGFGQTTGALWGVLAGYQSSRWAVIEERNSFSLCPTCTATAASHCSTIATTEGHRCCRETGRGFAKQCDKQQISQ